MICRNCGGQVAEEHEHRQHLYGQVVGSEFTCPPVDWMKRALAAERRADLLVDIIADTHEGRKPLDRLLAERDDIWTLLGSTEKEAADDPDVARLPDAVRVSLEFERAHIDSGEWATRPHHKHLCESCGHIWREEEYFAGVGDES